MQQSSFMHIVPAEPSPACMTQRSKINGDKSFFIKSSTRHKTEQRYSRQTSWETTGQPGVLESGTRGRLEQGENCMHASQDLDVGMRVAGRYMLLPDRLKHNLGYTSMFLGPHLLLLAEI